jgi:hypothetical protein
MDIKKFLLMIAILLVANVSNAQESTVQKFKKLAWLTGTWNRTNAGVGKSGYETWSKVSDVKLTGKGVSIEGKKIVFVENLEFIAVGTDIFYTVVVTGEKKPVYFKLTALSNNGFTCENPKHDFPKKITYQRSGNTIKAVISGNGQSVDYIFVRKAEK